MNRSISIPEWHQMALQGNAPPVRIQLSGYSMNPLIRGYQDYVTVAPAEGEIRTGDIVMFCEPGTGRYVMHRVWDQRDGQYLIWGDNCPKPDGWMPADAIWGRITLIERGQREIRPDPAKGVRWARFWHQAGKVYRFCRRVKEGILRRINRLRGTGK